jgi:cell division protein FtsB
MNQDIVNLYIEKLLSEVTESVKTRILLQTQLAYTEKQAAELQQKNAVLEENITKLEASLNKKASKQVKEDF